MAPLETPEPAPSWWTVPMSFEDFARRVVAEQERLHGSPFGQRLMLTTAITTPAGPGRPRVHRMGE